MSFFKYGRKSTRGKGGLFDGYDITTVRYVLDSLREIGKKLEYIDYVILMEDDTPVNLIKALKPGVTVKGRDWEDKRLLKREVVEGYGGQVCFIKGY